MSVSVVSNVETLLQCDAGNAVYDALVQSNVNPRSVPVETLRTMLREELQFRRMLGRQI